MKLFFDNLHLILAAEFMETAKQNIFVFGPSCASRHIFLEIIKTKFQDQFLAINTNETANIVFVDEAPIFKLFRLLEPASFNDIDEKLINYISLTSATSMSSHYFDGRSFEFIGTMIL